MKLRTWVTPLTLGAFLLTGVTGLLMFFKIGSGLVTIAHEWLSLLFVLGAALHTWLNWSAVRAHLSRPIGRLIVGLFAALLLLSLLPVDDHLPVEHGGDLGYRAFTVLMEAPVETVAALTRRTPVELREALSRQGIRVTADTATLAEAAKQNHTHPSRVLAAALAGPEHGSRH